MLIEEIITIFKNFPKKHIVTLSLGFLGLIGVYVLGSKDFTEQNFKNELSKPLKLLALAEDSNLEVPFIEKERLIKRNDSLFAILNQLEVPKVFIINLINSKISCLLSKIEV